MVVAGELQLNQQTATGQRKGVDAITIHPDFNGSTLQNDIAILTVRSASLAHTSHGLSFHELFRCSSRNR